MCNIDPGEVVPIPRFPASDLNIWTAPDELENCRPYVDID